MLQLTGASDAGGLAERKGTAKVMVPATGKEARPSSLRETGERVLQTLLRRVNAIILVAFVVTGSALGFSLAQAPTYVASVKILVGQESAGDTNLAGDVSGLQELTLTVAKAAQTMPVAQAVVEQLNLPEQSAKEVLRNMSAEPDPGTMFVNISYKSSDPKRAQLIANTIGEVLSQKISEVSVGANALTATVWAPATLPQTPVSPDPVRNSILALVLGSLLGVVLAFLLEYVYDSWDSPEEVELVSGVRTFGVVPKFEVLANKRAHKEHGSGDLPGLLVTVLDPAAPASEAYRALRTNLLYAAVDAPPKVILVASPGSAEGKSITAANLAVVLAQADKETLVVDGDLREPNMHTIFETSNLNGVVNVLAGEHNLSEVWQELLPELKLVSAGPIPPNPAELLSSDRFAELVAQARRLFDYVIIDSSSMEFVSDPMIIATRADAVLLVLDPQRTGRGSLRKAVRSLRAVGAEVLGTVMNKVEKVKGGRYGRSYYT
jgi:capsular exopolysaccharide synthesis family protein